MARELIPAKLVKFNHLTETVRELVLSYQEGHKVEFRSGQFITLHVPQEGSEKKVKRAYTIASSHDYSDSLTLLFKLVPGGIASEYVRHLQVGDTLEITGPFGKHFLIEPVTENIYFFCTGAGVSQHISYLLSHHQQLKNSNLKMYFGVWNETEVFYREELESVKKVLPQFEFEYVVDAPLVEEAWPGKTGYVTDSIGECILDADKSTFYLCGNPGMIKSVKEKLAEAGIGKESISSEAFH